MSEQIVVEQKVSPKFTLVIDERFNGEKTGKRIQCVADTGEDLYKFDVKNHFNGTENYKSLMETRAANAKRKEKRRTKIKNRRKKLGKGREEIREYTTYLAR